MATTTNYSWTTPDDTALVKDGAAAIRSLGTAIDTTVFNNAGASIAKTIVDAKGDIIAATAADTVARLAVGANNTVLTADSTTATGLKWATASGGGKVLQVVSATTTTSTTIATTTQTDTTITASITPTSATSKVLVLIQCHVQGRASQAEFKGGGRLLRDATVLQNYATGGLFVLVVNASSNPTFVLNETNIPFTYLDSPATTSATTYKLQGACDAGTNLYYQNGDAPSTITLLEIGA
jgi:hypothetical protein